MLFPDRLERILTVVYVAQSYWACFGLYSSSCMWKTNDHNVSETGSVSVPIHLRTETDPVSETLWSFVFHIQDDEYSPKQAQ
jgi:hypothetical protein